MTQATRPKHVCSVAGCELVVSAKGYCPAHYQRWKRWGDPGSAEIHPPAAPCSVEGCDRKASAHGYCAAHAKRVQRTGSAGTAEIAPWPEKLKARQKPPRPRKNASGPPGKCVVERCESLRYSREGYCAMHAQRLRRRGTLEIPARAPLITKCSIAGCAYVGRLRRGWCSIHYGRWYTHGDPFYKRPSAEERFWAKVDKNGPIPEHRPDLGPCWLRRSKKNHGYGVFSIGKKSISAHRYAYELVVGPIPDGYQIDHLCHHPDLCELAEQCPHRRCVNPAHLEAVTCRVNLMRSGSIQAWHAARTRRREGREVAPETMVYRKGRRYRTSMLGWPAIQDEPDKAA